MANGRGKFTKDVIGEQLQLVLEATGYLNQSEPAHGVRLGSDAERGRHGRNFMPDASWRGQSATTVYFKSVDSQPDDRTVSAWQREIWNEGFAPLLWVVSPHRIELYNGFGRPESNEDAARHRLRTFEAIEQQLIELDQLAGRLAMETGQYWTQALAVNRKTSVDEQLLADLAALEGDLVGVGLNRLAAQGLIGRTIFTQYLTDRQIVTPNRLNKECGASSLSAALRQEAASGKLFDWLANAFNGDMFPATAVRDTFDLTHLTRVADFLDAVDPDTGQRTFFPYQFNVIPVELISSIYEQFAHSKAATPKETSVPEAPEVNETPAEAKKRGVHYTRLPVVSLILDEVMDGIAGDETVLDLTCGSGVFLVEALRRLVARKGGQTPSREFIRKTLYTQVYGVDLSEAAVRVAAFSLYLAALELDPNPQPPEALKFEKLIGRSLFVGNARNIETTNDGAALLSDDGSCRKFDIVVGNPPWTFRGKEGTKERKATLRSGTPRQPRGESLDFVLRALDFSHDTTRFGVVLDAMPFFSGSGTGSAATRHIVERLKPVTLVNLAAHTKWLFPTASKPAVVLLARQRKQSGDRLTLVNVPWSPSAERSYAFDIAPGDISSLSLKEWSSNPKHLKLAMVGSGRDRILLEELQRQFNPFRTWLEMMQTDWRDGLTLGKEAQRTRDASQLIGLPFLETKDLEPFQVPSNLEPFCEPRAQWPRSRDIYGRPLLLIKEFFKSGPRAVTAVAERDTVYTDAYFGASLGNVNPQAVHLISGILSSSLTSWFFQSTASEFGIWKRRLHVNDVDALPLPDPDEALKTQAGQRIVELAYSFRDNGTTPDGLCALDEAVFDLYRLDDADRIVARDGLIRAGWQWSLGKIASAEQSTLVDDLIPYAETFAIGIDNWLQALNKRHVRAEIFDLPELSPLRAIRFVIAEGRREPTVEVLPTQGDLATVLDGIGNRIGVRLGSAIIGERELRVHGRDEVIIIKPAARRFWMKSIALGDSDAVVSESFTGGTA